MAKKRSQKDLDDIKPVDTNKAIDDLYERISKKYGEGVIESGADFASRKRLTIPIGPALDMVMGGIQEGSWVGITGPPKTCKSTTALSFAANCQRFGRPVMYGDVEHRLTDQHLHGIQGLKLEKPYFTHIHSTKTQQLTQTKHLEIYLDFLKNVPGGVLIIDSISSFAQEKVVNSDEVGTETRGGAAKLFSNWIEMVRDIVAPRNCIVVGITQQYKNTSGYGKQNLEKVAEAFKYQCDYKLAVSKADLWELSSGKKKGEEKKKKKSSDPPPIGWKIEWLSETTKTGFPMQIVESYVRFGVGIDTLTELINFGKTCHLIDEKGGGWTTFTFLENHLEEWNEEVEKSVRVQGLDKAYQLLKENPQWQEWLYQDVYEMLTGVKLES